MQLVLNSFPYYLMLNLKQGTLCICMEWIVQQAPNFNMGWYGQVIEIVGLFYSNYHRYWCMTSYEHVTNYKNTMVKKHAHIA